jgi:hypothetical protein
MLNASDRALENLSALRHIRKFLSLFERTASATFSSTVNSPKILVTWNVRAMPTATRR